jgi:hypothetical protein
MKIKNKKHNFSDLLCDTPQFYQVILGNANPAALEKAIDIPAGESSFIEIEVRLNGVDLEIDFLKLFSDVEFRQNNIERQARELGRKNIELTTKTQKELAALRVELASVTWLAEAYREENEKLLDEMAVYRNVAVMAKRLAVRDYMATRESSDILDDLISALKELAKILDGKP